MNDLERIRQQLEETELKRGRDLGRWDIWTRDVQTLLAIIDAQQHVIEDIQDTFEAAEYEISQYYHMDVFSGFATWHELGRKIAALVALKGQSHD